jgi:cytochrome bd-type quinol oxidase subunit 1
LRTADATGKVSEGALGASLTGYVTVYALMFTAYMVVLTHLARKGSQT